MAEASQEAAVLQAHDIHGHHANTSPNRETPMSGKTSTLKHKLVRGAYRFQVSKCHAVRGMDISHAPTEMSSAPRHAFSRRTRPFSRAL